MEGRGCVHLYTGDGKGKTTAAVGLAARAAGQGLRVAFCQFMKDGRSGEVAALQKLGVAVFSPCGQNKFYWAMDTAEKAACAAAQRQILQWAAGRQAGVDLLVLDEVVCAVELGLLERGALEALLDEKPQALELVLTGRGADEALMKRADYVTEMRAVAHPFAEGRPAKKGVEF